MIGGNRVVVLVSGGWRSVGSGGLGEVGKRDVGMGMGMGKFGWSMAQNSTDPGSYI